MSETNQMEFRDGLHAVPDHMRPLLEGIETYQITWAQAQALVNRRLMGNFLTDVQDRTIAAHLRNAEEH